MVFSQIIGSATQVFSKIYKESKIALMQEINVYLYSVGDLLILNGSDRDLMSSIM